MDGETINRVSKDTAELTPAKLLQNQWLESESEKVHDKESNTLTHGCLKKVF